MRKIKQGTIYGYEIFIEVPDDFPEDDLVVNEHTLEKHIEREKQNEKKIN